MKMKKWSSNQKLEYWKTIEGYSNYMISSLGRVKSLNYRHTGKAKIMKLNKNKYGYLCVNLFKNGKGKRYCVHRLVTSAFISNPENKPCIDHIDTNPSNNNVKNLRWVSHKENMNNPLSRKKNSEAHKGKIFSEEHRKNISEANKGEKHPRAKKVRCIETGDIFDCIKYAVEWCGLKSVASIIMCCQGKKNSAGKHPVTGQKLTWEYVDEETIEVNLNLLIDSNINIKI